MRKSVKLLALLGALVIVCAAAFLISRSEEKKELIKNSGEQILSIAAEDVTALSWTNEEGNFSFTRDDGWHYDGDVNFPVDGEKLNALLAQFADFTADFIIEQVEDYAQYGLDEPVCTICITAAEQSYTLTLGDYSKMDSQRYASIDDGNAYLLTHDPLDEFDAVLSDVVLHDTIPAFDVADELAFTGIEDYTITREEETGSLCAEDEYFTGDRPLDTDNVEAYLNSLRTLKLTDYVNYYATEEDLQAYGLDEPELTLRLAYSTVDEEGSVSGSGTLTLHLARDPEELAAYDQAVAEEADELPTVSCYAQLDGSQLVYSITQSEFEALTAMQYNTLRHQTLFTAAFDDVTAIDVTLDGEQYALVCTQPTEEELDEDEDEDAQPIWSYQDIAFDEYDLRNALRSLTATAFTDEDTDGEQELSLVIQLDNEAFPRFVLTLRRYDGESCLALVDGEPVAYVSRAQTVELIEAIHAIVLNRAEG